MMSDISRRRILTTGAIGVAGLAAVVQSSSPFGVITAQANTQNPPEPQVSVNPNGRFAGKVVLITGATSGIGEATARAFAAEGATVHFCGRRETLGEQVAQSIWDGGGNATYQRADVRLEEDVKAVVDTCVAQYGKIDIAFNNAGIFMTPAEVQDIPLDNFVDIMMTNTVGEFLCMKYEISHMRRQGGGNIINMASVAGHVGFRNTAHYNASKHGVIGLTKATAQENADYNIRINSISPLAVDTPQLRESFAFQGITYEQAVQGFVTKRIMTPHEIAEAVMFLASNQATSMTGMDLDVTGGQLAG
jgi:NAD(P)-dependent dehydrogenase (short-subunit alcohol dehydrogenase family)